MAESTEFPVLYVEGRTDLHTICQLLRRHDVELDARLGPVVVKDAGGDEGVLHALRTAVLAAANRAVGFVMDANGSVADRWRSIRHRLRGLDITMPEIPPIGGSLGDVAALKARVGVWIMPDNATDAGHLEHLVQTLIPRGDVLFEHAKAATDQAVKLDARFPEQERVKAELHCWLAWQSQPGGPFGTAIKAHFFRHDSEVALRFVSWFENLFQDVLR